MTTVTPMDPARLGAIADQALAGAVISPDEALALYRGLDQPSLGLLAHSVRRRKHPERRVTSPTSSTAT